MTKSKSKAIEGNSTTRKFPEIKTSDTGDIHVSSMEPETLTRLYNVKTDEFGRGMLAHLIQSLGQSAGLYRAMAAAFAAELEPRDAVEAMLANQLVATHLAIAQLSGRMMDQSTTETWESCERSVTRLSRTFIAQTDALKKYRAKAQQVVRVERVNISEGGKAIIGDVDTGREGGEREK